MMKGDVTLRVECLLPERLIERALERGAWFESLSRPDDKTLLVRCDERSARRLLALCRRYGLSARVTGLRGRGAVHRFAHRRRTLPAGLLLAIVLSSMFLSRVWRIDLSVSGADAAPGELSRLLEALDIEPGRPRDFDPALLAQALLARADNYSYVGARLQGVRLLVEAVPEAPAPSIYDVDAARDLVCAEDGVVVRAIARTGALCVMPGDVVRRGQLLIRGEALSGEENATRPVAALGEVIIRTWFEGEAAIPLQRTRWEYTGRSSVGLKLAGPGFERTLAAADSFSRQSERVERLPIGGLFLPLELQRVTRREIRQVSSAIDPEQLKPRVEALALADAALALARGGPNGYTPVKRWTDYEYADGALWARVVLEIQTDAAVTRETLQGG